MKKDHSSDGHDSNISYYDGSVVRYAKTERIFSEKHHRLWHEECDAITKRLWGITRSDVDDCVYVSSGRKTITDDPGYLAFAKHLYYTDSDGTKFIDHHCAHAESVALLNEVDASIVIDGRGSLKSWSIYRKDKLVDCGFVDEAGSIGEGLISIRRHFNISGHGLDVSGKLMGLQSYGKKDLSLMKELLQYNMNNIDPVFSYASDQNLDALHTIHERCGEAILELFSKHFTPHEKIGYSGGVAQNVIWNSKLKQAYRNLVIMPYSSDDGLSLGGIEFLRKQYNLSKLTLSGFPYSQSDEAPKAVCEDLDRVARALAKGKIVAWYQGNGEIGPRALGHRSILMDPRIADGRDKINRIKKREFFRPFGASILQEYAKEYFDVDYDNPHMLYVGKTQKDNLKSITHVDGTCRFQTVSHGIFYDLLERFHKLTNCPVLLNTSLNVSGKPISAYTMEAKREFIENDKIDMLVVGDEIYER